MSVENDIACDNMFQHALCFHKRSICIFSVQKMMIPYEIDNIFWCIPVRDYVSSQKPSLLPHAILRVREIFLFFEIDVPKK